MKFTIQVEREEDGRWLAEVRGLPGEDLRVDGALAYGDTEEKAITKATALALRVVADRVAHGEVPANGLVVAFQP